MSPNSDSNNSFRRQARRKPAGEYPYLPLWTDSWAAETKHMTRLERGTYLDLLILLWRSPGQRVPNDDQWLSRHLMMTQEEVKNELHPIILEFCQNDGNWITNEKISAQFLYAKKLSKQRSDAAKSRWNKEKDICERNAASYQSRNASILNYSKGSEESKKEEDTPSALVSANGSYAFECGIIKLNQKDFDQWQQSFSELDLRSELTALAGWDKLTKKGWFVAVANALAKRNREVIAQKAAIKIGIENGMRPPQRRFFRV